MAEEDRPFTPVESGSEQNFEAQVDQAQEDSGNWTNELQDTWKQAQSPSSPTGETMTILGGPGNAFELVDDSHKGQVGQAADVGGAGPAEAAAQGEKGKETEKRLTPERERDMQILREQIRQGQVTFGKDGLPQPPAPQEKPRTEQETDQDGRVSEITYGRDGKTPASRTVFRPDGKTPESQTEYGPDGKTVVSRTEFHEDGKTPKSVTKQHHLGGQDQTRYDSQGRMTQQTITGADGKPIYDAKFNAAGNVTELNDGGVITKNTYDATGKVLQGREVTTPDGKTHWYDGAGNVLRHRDADGKEFVHTRGKDGKEHVAEDKPIKDLFFNPHVGLSPERKQVLDDQLKDLAKGYANDKNEINFEQHGKLLQELASRKDLTEHDKLYMLGSLVQDYRNSKDGKGGTFKLTAEGANPEVLNDFDSNRLRHQVIEPTNDGYHTKLAEGTWDDAVRGVIGHEGATKQILNAGRWLLGAEGGGFGVNKGDGVASLHQAAAIMNARASGQWSMRAYAQEWNKRFVKR